MKTIETIKSVICDNVSLVTYERKKAEITEKMETKIELINVLGDRGLYRIFKDYNSKIVVYYHAYCPALSESFNENRYNTNGLLVSIEDNYIDAYFESSIHCKYRIG